MIGEAFEVAVVGYIQRYLADYHPDYELLDPLAGKKALTLAMTGGLLRQIDNIITPKGSQQPVALLETKWLKDARHHNDKGAWILQLREIRKNYASIRGSIAILAGYWTEGVGLMLQNEGGVKMILVATDAEVYSTLQPHLDRFLGDHTFALDAKTMRQSYPHPEKLAALVQHLKEHHLFDSLVASWFGFERLAGKTGLQLIYQALDEVLVELVTSPQATRFEITIEVSSGNLIHKSFTDLEEAQQFLVDYANPANILKMISPKPDSKDTI
jgi:hypothetical protein